MALKSKQSSQRVLRISHANVRSILAHSRLLNIQIMCVNHMVDILCLSETWLNAKHPQSIIQIPGFQEPFRHDRLSGRGGGVAVYVRDGLGASVINSVSSPLFECVVLSVTTSYRSTLTVITCYRPPESDVYQFVYFLDQILSQLPEKHCRNLCIVGDFNAKHSTWLPSQHSDLAGDELYNLALSHGLSQVVSESTYTTLSGKKVLLDLMFVNQPQLVKSCTVLPPLADHCPTHLTLFCTRARMTSNTKKLTKAWCWNHPSADYDGLREALSYVDWSVLQECNDASIAVSLWEKLLFSVVANFIPSKITVTQSKPWYSAYLHRLARTRDRLFRRAKGLESSSHCATAYRNVRNLYVKELRFAQRQYHRNLGRRLSRECLNVNPQFWWSQIKAACGWSIRKAIPTLTDGQQKILLTSADKAEALNAFFAQQCSAPVLTSNPHVSVHVQKTPEFAFSEVSRAEVLDVLKSLNVWKSSGLDEISARLLKECRNELAWPLCYLFNLSISTSVYPDAWKKAVVFPLYKHKGDRQSLSAYRPISLLSAVSKVFGRVVKKQLLKFCTDNLIIPDEQFGFLPGRSTVWQLLSILETWQEALDSGHVVHALFVDVAKAFDRVNHELLLAKLRAAGAAASALKWLDSYLVNRKICTRVDGAVSSFKLTTSGVPQGSVLGPLLFLIYFRDLPAAIQSSTTAMFADDTLVYDVRCNSSSCCSVASNLPRLNVWAQNWNVTFNACKSADMLISRRRTGISRLPPTLSLQGEQVPRCREMKHLGVVLTKQLSWSAHVQYLVRKVASKVVLLKRMAYNLHLPSYAVERCYLSMVRPILEYASPVWNSCSKSDGLRLEKLQLSVARAALGIRRHDLSDSAVLSRIGWPTLAWRRRHQILFLFWKLRNGEGPPVLAAMVPKSINDRVNYGFRKAASLQMPFCATEQHLNSFLPSATILWNSLPADLQSHMSSSIFRQSLINHFASDRFSFGL